MPGRADIVLCALILSCAGILSSASASPAPAAPGTGTLNSCVQCHSRLPDTSFIGAKSHSWTGSIHQQHGVTCDKCHGGDPRAADRETSHAGISGSRDPRSPVYYKNIPATCGACHGAEFYKFTQSLHYRRLEASGKGPECVTCHGSMVTSILSPDPITAVCEQCHNERLGIRPYIPQKAKAVLLLLRESESLLKADERRYHPAKGSAAERHLREARSSLYSARLDWHRFDLDTVTGHLQNMYTALQQLSPAGSRR